MYKASIKKFLLISSNVFIIVFYFNIAYQASRDEEEFSKGVQASKSKVIDQTELEWKNMSHAIVHMGPHKTGSSSIQQVTITYKQQLMEDGYFLPYIGFTAETGIELRSLDNQMSFSTCFVDDYDYPKVARYCVPKLLNYAARIGKDKKNIFLTSESFSKMDTEGIRKLSNYLNRHWDKITIIVYYRRYYDYLCSLYDQTHKKRSINNDDHEWRWEESLLDFIEDELYDGDDFKYTAELVSRLKQHFDLSNANIVIMNFHDRSMDLSERFYCEAMPYAINTCNAIRNSSTTFTRNPSKYLGYSDLAYAAMQKNLLGIRTQKDMNIAIASIQQYHEHTLNRTTLDFKLKCLSNQTLQRLLKKSLKYQRALLPELDENDLRADFMKQAKSKLCSIDLKYTLNQQVWKDFFSKK